jgi:hypothetical protein
VGTLILACATYQLGAYNGAVDRFRLARDTSHYT